MKLCYSYNAGFLASGESGCGRSRTIRKGYIRIFYSDVLSGVGSTDALLPCIYLALFMYLQSLHFETDSNYLKIRNIGSNSRYDN